MQNPLNSYPFSTPKDDSWEFFLNSNNAYPQLKPPKEIFEGKLYQIFPKVEIITDDDIIREIIEMISKIQSRPPVIGNIAKLSQKTVDVLGMNGLVRFNAFKNYEKGWDGKNALPVSNRSSAVMEYFVNRFLEFRQQPSLFLSKNGNFQLGWENSKGQKVELEFFPDKIEYYIEAIDAEGEIEILDYSMDDLILKLRENEY